jgi:dGTP triphosphohydrolase
VLFKAYQAGRMTLDAPLSEDEAGEPHERRIVDTLACMTDDQALFLSQRLED